MTQCTESSVTESGIIVAQLKKRVEQVTFKDALDTLDALIEDCKQALTTLKALQEQANQPTKEVK